ncbi:MAG: hypothetical protein Q9213_000871 [Squamulea squamosa]
MTIKPAAAAVVVARNDQPPSYEEGSSSPVPVYDKGSGNPPRILVTNEKSALHPSATTTSINASPANTTPPPTQNKILIPFKRHTHLSLPYTPHLASLSITESEWESFTSALGSAATLSGAQKAKAITAAVAAGVLVNPWLGVAVGLWVWRKEGRRVVEEGVGKVLEEWNEFWKERRVRVGLVREGGDGEGKVEVGRVEDEGRRCGRWGRGCGQGRGCGGRKRKGCCWKDRGLQLLVERIEDERTDELKEKVKDLEKVSIGMQVEDVDERKE